MEKGAAGTGKRKVYKSHKANARSAKFAYCLEERRWFLFTGDMDDACDTRKHELARSSKTDTFDIYAAFGEPWLSSSNTPLEVYFFEDIVDDAWDEICEAFIDDGNCDLIYNTFDYQYDGGDCCSATCTESACGLGALHTAFGIQHSMGDGFQIGRAHV